MRTKEDYKEQAPRISDWDHYRKRYEEIFRKDKPKEVEPKEKEQDKPDD